MKKYIDMHIHTNHSDGAFSAEECLKIAQNKKISIISITDHNDISAYDEIKGINKNKIYFGKIIPGIEITTTYEGEVIEILGYGFDISIMKKLLKENVYSFYDKQIAEAKLNFEAFEKMGVFMDEKFKNTMRNDPKKNFDPHKTSSKNSFLEEIKKHPENAKFF